MRDTLLSILASFAAIGVGLIAFVWFAHYELCRETGADWLACIIVAGAL